VQLEERLGTAAVATRLEGWCHVYRCTGHTRRARCERTLRSVCATFPSPKWPVRMQPANGGTWCTAHY
jgi:hypothetical protein